MSVELIGCTLIGFAAGLVVMIGIDLYKIVLKLTRR